MRKITTAKGHKGAINLHYVSSQAAISTGTFLPRPANLATNFNTYLGKIQLAILNTCAFLVCVSLKDSAISFSKLKVARLVFRIIV